MACEILAILEIEFVLSALLGRASGDDIPGRGVAQDGGAKLLVDRMPAFSFGTPPASAAMKAIVDDPLGGGDLGRLRIASAATASRTSWSETSRDDRTAECRAGGQILAASGGSLELAIAPDQLVGRAVVLELRLRRAFQFGNDALREGLAEFHAPLIEGIDLPDRRLA